MHLQIQSGLEYVSVQEQDQNEDSENNEGKKLTMLRKCCKLLNKVKLYTKILALFQNGDISAVVSKKGSSETRNSVMKCCVVCAVARALL